MSAQSWCGRSFRNVYILESRVYWESCRLQFDVSSDLVLTYDFGLLKEVEQSGGMALFIDHIVDSEIMQQNNFLIYDFFKKWNLDKDGNDLFVHRGVPFGFSFRVDIWNDFTFYLRIRTCLEELFKNLRFESVFAGAELGLVETVLTELDVPFSVVSKSEVTRETYFFPIYRYMHENTRSFSWKSKLKDYFMLLQGSVMPWWDKLTGNDKKPLIFIHEYHPTRKILAKLRDSSRVRVLVERISATTGALRFITERPIPLWGSVKQYENEADELMKGFQDNHRASLVLYSGSNVSKSVYHLIEAKLRMELGNQLRVLDAIINYVNANPVSMEILIGNVGRFPTLLDCVLKQKNVPSYLIINGLLGPEYSDESKYASVINGYSVSIKEQYFAGMDNVVCLGDPRMDAYAPLPVKKVKPAGAIRITIGASGFNPVDLNSYVAVEFDFLHDVLCALMLVEEKGVALEVVVKVRPNGYVSQYESFVAEFFPDLECEIIASKTMSEVLAETDFYISIYSQTLFEASCMGIPVLYYKKDNEIMDAPFDGKCELVTVDQVGMLADAVVDFHAGHKRFDAFLQRSVMEKYIGFLDGKNVVRNIDYIYSTLEEGREC